MTHATQARVLASGLSFPEGPAFDSSGSLWCVELRGGRLWRRDPAGAVSTIRVDGRPNGLAIDAQDRLWFCDAGRNQVRILEPGSGKMSVAAAEIEGIALAEPNDLIFDRAGNLLFTCPGGSRESAVGYLCCRTPDGDVSKVATGLQFPNGLALRADGDVLIVAETRRRRLWSGRWDSATRVWSDPSPFSDTDGPIGPDGLCIDASGRMFVAIYGAGQIEVKDAAGRTLGTLPTPGSNPTNCALDPNCALGLVVTEAERGEVLSFGLDPFASRGPDHHAAGEMVTAQVGP